MKSHKDVGTDGNYNYILSLGENTVFRFIQDFENPWWNHGNITHRHDNITRQIMESCAKNNLC